MMSTTADPQTPPRRCAGCRRATTITIDGHWAGRPAGLCPECYATRQRPIVVAEVPEQFN